MKTLTRNKNARRSYNSNDERWNAVIHRDKSADGKFFYSVKTTGVYCRPSCGARLARRENVAFYNRCDDAERAGFRPCKRCQPRGLALDEFYADAIARACRVIQSAEKMPALDALAKSSGMSAFHFHRVFKKMTGLTPKNYAMAQRAERVRSELPKRKNVTEAIYSSGFNSSGRFYAESPKMLGMTPKNFRKGGEGTTIRFAVGKCSLGSILVASSDKGLCAISLGDDPKKLVEELQRRFPKARLIDGGKDFRRTLAQVVAFVEKPRIGLKLPLDIRGTAFQQRVWSALQKIPLGSTTSYSEIAKRIGAPKSVRAVAGAVAANNLAVAIPCHRVLHLDGGISGYRWGVARKRKLLEKEKSKL